MNSHDDITTTDNPSKAIVSTLSQTEHISTTKRTLLKAGWVVPVVGVISLPASGAVRYSGPIED